MRRILFVCTGNTCRSPLAAAIATRIAGERAPNRFEIGSAGTDASEGAPASDGSLLVGLEHELDLSGHRARLLTRDMVAHADLILAMGPHHLERIEELGGARKAHLLTAYASRDVSQEPVSDPFDGDLDVYRATFSELEEKLLHVFDRLVAERGPGAS